MAVLVLTLGFALPVSAKAAPYTKTTITYCSPGGVPVQADVYLPKVARNGRLVFYIHGGGFSSGDKSEATSNTYRRTAVEAMTSAGTVVASLNYRLVPTYRWPAQLDDVRCAVRYFRANAALWGIDPARIGAWGGSAGGTLAAFLGVDGVDRAKAVLPAYGPMNYLSMPPMPPDGDPNHSYDAIFGPGWTEQTLIDASPITYVSADDAPFLLQYGFADQLMPWQQGQEMHDALVAAGVPSTLTLVTGGDHGFVNATSPTKTQLGNAVASYFAARL